MRKKRNLPLAHVGPEGRVALCEILGDVIEAKSWKDARAYIDRAALVDRPEYGVEASGDS